MIMIYYLSVVSWQHVSEAMCNDSALVMVLPCYGTLEIVHAVTVIIVVDSVTR